MRISDLENYLQHDPDLAASITEAADELLRRIETAAIRSAELNSRWHDDPSQPDYAAFHASPAEQYPPELRLEFASKILTQAQAARP